MRIGSLAGLALVGIGLAGLAACRAPGRFDVTAAYPAEGVVARLRVERTRITVAQSLLVILEADASPGVTPRIPSVLETQGDQSFSIQDTGEDRPKSLARGMTRFSRWFRLEPFLSGDYVLPSQTVEVVDEAGVPALVRTEPVRVQVTSLLPADYARLDIRDIRGALRPPWRPPAGIVVVLGVLLAASAATGVWLLLQKRALDRRSPPTRPAHEIAYEDLRALVAEDLVAQGEVKLFYQRVTGILRVYVERRFGLRAPERTTEEFLGELKRTDLLPEDLKRLLEVFLQHADLVKFAQHRPLGDEIERTLSSCRDFVRATEPVLSEADRAV